VLTKQSHRLLPQVYRFRLAIEATARLHLAKFAKCSLN
jgi:hypothetical protein